MIVAFTQAELSEVFVGTAGTMVVPEETRTEPVVETGTGAWQNATVEVSRLESS